MCLGRCSKPGSPDSSLGADYAISGADGVHPGWAGHTVMAYAFLKAMGLDGAIGTFPQLDLRTGILRVSEGREVMSAQDGSFEYQSGAIHSVHAWRRARARPRTRFGARTIRLKITAFVQP